MRIPIATYRLQFNAEFPFSAAVALVPYLDELGITDCYASPLAATRPGSPHGYDVVDHERLNPELGGDEGFQRLAAELRAREMSILLDLVPNHMCIAGADNRRWLDVLEHGPSSRCARFFDIDWRPPKAELANKVLLPVLGEQYGRALESGIALAYGDGGFWVAFYDTRLPLGPRTWVHLLVPALEALRAAVADEDAAVLELESIVRALGHLPLRTETAPAKVRERMHETEIVRRRLAALMSESPAARAAVEEAVRAINGAPGDPHSFDRLEAVLAEQAYRLSHWRVAAHEINYRRFFDINDLAAIRVEDPVVFAATHALPLRLAREGVVTGFRIDHVDGLFDPERYLHDLTRSFREATGAEDGPYLVVEKILEPLEPLPAERPVQGTTGYDFLNLASSVLVDPTAGPRFRELFARMAGEAIRFSDVVYTSKKLVLKTALAAELWVLSRKLDRISEQHRYTRDFTLNSSHQVLTEVIACFPVYRTYIRPGDVIVTERDRHPIDIAFRLAKRRNPVLNESLFDFVRSVLLLDDPSGLSEAHKEQRREFVLRFQQLTGPVMAKGLEDTAFYRYFPLSALNEVGGDPDAFGFSVEEFHRRNRDRARLAPLGPTATATHDTKRGEDTRARILALSEMPEDWSQAVSRWREMNRRWKIEVGGLEAPDAAEEYLLYQTLVGAWPPGGPSSAPDFRARVQDYLRKAMLEAKVHTSWINNDEEWEQAGARFVAAVLDPAKSGAFLADFERFHAKVARAGYWNALAQLLLKIAAPGVPDFYQGTELWDLSLVDPDNRRPVDYERRRSALRDLLAEADRDAPALADRLMAAPEDGRLKLLVTARALRLRRARRELFERGAYEALGATGARADHVVAFARVVDGRAVIAVVGRHFVRLGADPPVGPAWGDTKLHLPDTLAGRTWHDALSGCAVGADRNGAARALPVAEVLARLPVALLDAA